MGLSSDVRVCEHIHSSIDYLWLSINCHVKQTLGTYSLCGDREMVTKFIWPIHLEAHKLLRNARNFFINQCLLVMKNSWHLDMIHFLTEHLKHSIFRIIQILDICTCISIHHMDFYQYLKLMKILYITLTHIFCYQLNFNKWLIYQLKITEIRVPHHQLLHVQNSSQSYMHAYISELSCVQNGSNHCGFMYKYTNIHVYHISIKNDTRIWTGKEMDILPIWSLSLSPPLSSLGWTWFSGGPGLSPQLQSQDLPPYKYQQACSEEIGFSTVQLTDRGSFIYHPTTNRLSPRHKVSQSRGLSG